MSDPIDRQAAIDAMCELIHHWFGEDTKDEVREINQELGKLPPAQTEDYAELKREFNLMAAYIDAILRCSDEQKETLNWFISRLAKHMPWTERDYSD